jgi:septal ring factor EnvC (AmiA/AmiB activator)
MMDGSSGFTKKRHEKILSVFDQTYIQDGDPQFVSMSGRDISEDKDMERIINRLAKAATISDIRMTMNIEDEIYSELENLDTKILSQKKALGQKDKQLAHQEEQLAHQEKQLTQQKELLRNTIKMLLETGKTPSEIADNLHLDIDDVNELI